jgi:hypothetical protein
MDEMSIKLTRRETVLGLSASAVLLAQTPAPPLPSNPDEELKAVRDQIQQNLQQLDNVKVLMSTEPAAHFKA